MDQKTIYEALIGLIENGPIDEDRNEEAVAECIERGWAEKVGAPYLCSDGKLRVGVVVTVAGRAVAEFVEGVVDDVESKAIARRELEVSSACLQVLRGLKIDISHLRDVGRVTPKHVINEIRKALVGDVCRKVLWGLKLYRPEEHGGEDLDVTLIVDAVGYSMAEAAKDREAKACSQILRALNLYDREKHGRVDLTPASVIEAVAGERAELRRRDDDDLAEGVAARAKRRELEIIDEISMSVFGAEVANTVEGLVEAIKGRDISTMSIELHEAEQLAADADKRTAQAEQHTDRLIDATAALMEEMRRMAAEAMEVTFARAMGREMKHMVDFNNPAQKARQRARWEKK